MGSSLILILALGRQGQIDFCDFQASQDFTVRPCHKKNKRKQKRKEEEEEAGGRRGWGGVEEERRKKEQTSQAWIPNWQAPRNHKVWHLRSLNFGGIFFLTQPRQTKIHCPLSVTS